MKKIKVLSESPEITKKIASKFAASVVRKSSRNARIVTLKGDSGSGKTTFVLGFLNFFRIKPHAASPTFVIMKRYKINSKLKTQNSKIKNIYHLDAYRLHSKKDLGILGFGEIEENPKNIILIEWPERIKRAVFKNKIAIHFSYGKKENERIIKL